MQHSPSLPAEGNRRSLATPEEVSGFLAIPVGTLYSWKHRGIGPTPIKVGRHLRYRWQEVEAWLDTQAAERAA
jgi:predicted DNA-binding transcriptional regulator AlpA